MKAPRTAVFLLFLLCSHLLISLPLSATVLEGSRFAGPFALSAPPADAASARLATTTVNSTIQRIRNRGNLMLVGILVTYPPFGFLDEQGEVAGFEVDLVRALAEQWGVNVQFVPVTPSTRLQRLMAGQVDLVVAMPHTYATEAQIDLSQTYFTDTPALLVPLDIPLTTLPTLAGKTIAVVQGDGALAQFQSALRGSLVETQILPSQEYAPALLALAAGQADALLAYSAYLVRVAQATPDFRVVFPFAESQPFAMGVAQGDSYFRNLLDATLTALMQDGIVDALYATWLPDRQPPPLEQLPGQWPYSFATTPTEFTLPMASRLIQIKERGKLLVGVAYDFAPFGFVGNDGNIEGFDIDLSREFARRWLGDPDALELVRVTAETAIPLLTAGQIDLIAAALPHTWRNRAEIDLSQSYFLDGLSVLARTDHPMQRLQDLHQKVIAVTSGLATIEKLAVLLSSTITDTLPDTATDTIMEPVLLPFQEYRSAQQALLAGQVDAVIGSSTALAQMARENAAVTIAVDRFLLQPYAIGIPSFDAPLRDQVNFTLQAMQVDGVYGALYTRWFATTPDTLELWPDGATTTEILVDGAQPLRLLDPVAAQLPTVRSNEEQPVISVDKETPPGQTPQLRPTRMATPASPLIPVLAPTNPPATLGSTHQSLILVATSTPVARSVVTTPVTATVSSATVSSALPALIATAGTLPLSLVATPTVTETVAQPATILIRPNINANARQAPTTTAPILRVLAGGTSWLVLSISPDRQWVQVQLPDQVRGWVAMQLVSEQAAIVPTSVFTPTRTPVVSAEPAALAVTPTPRLLFTTAITHRVGATETLATIAKRYYGNQSLWRLIYEANRTTIGDDPNAIPVGAALVIPPPP